MEGIEYQNRYEIKATSNYSTIIFYWTLANQTYIPTFSEKLMPFGKFKNKSFQALYFENYNYCLWLSENIQDPKYDLLDFIQLVKKYKSPIYTPKNQ